MQVEKSKVCCLLWSKRGKIEVYSSLLYLHKETLQKETTNPNKITYGEWRGEGKEGRTYLCIVFHLVLTFEL
jgi:hypothetical protein